MGTFATADRTYFITLRLKFPDSAFLKDLRAPFNKSTARSPLLADEKYGGDQIMCDG